MTKNNMMYLLYKTIPGRLFLQFLQKSHTDRLIVRFLRSRLSRPFLLWYVKHNRIPLTRMERKQYRSFRDFFARNRGSDGIDITPGHLISPCGGWLSTYPIRRNSSFSVKGSNYRIADLLEEEKLAGNYIGGVCLVFRLCPSDYHHYCYIDDGYQGANHFIPGMLHSVQPIACRSFPVYTLNRRSWCLMATEHFGPVVETEIGALIVGGICNSGENTRFCKGFEKGHFELAGSTIILLFEPGRIRLLPELERKLQRNAEVRVEMGCWIGNSIRTQSR